MKKMIGNFILLAGIAALFVGCESDTTKKTTTTTKKEVREDKSDGGQRQQETRESQTEYK